MNGGSIGFPAWSVILLVVVTLTVRKAIRHRRLRPLWPILPTFLIWAFFANWCHTEVHYWDGWEWNVTLAPGEAVGTWTYEKEAVTLAANGSALLPGGKVGRWSEAAGYVSADGFLWVPMRRSGELVLLPRDPRCLHDIWACGDPDEWSKYTVWTRRSR